MLICEHLGKEYRGVWVLRDFNLQCGPGMLGLIGPNGAGKTTLSRILATLLPQSEGSVTWNGKDTRTQGEAIRCTLGYLPQEFGLYPELSGRQFLTYLAAMKGLPSTLAKQRVEEVLEIVNLRGTANKKLKNYSGGMKRRIGIAQALLNDPMLLIVDEPTAGLDIEERVRFRTLLSDLATNRLIILSTHIISDVEAVASRLVIMQQGQKIEDTTPETLITQAIGHVWTLTTDITTSNRLQETYKVSNLVSQQHGTQLRILSDTRPHEEATVAEPTLEDAYLLKIQMPNRSHSIPS